MLKNLNDYISLFVLICLLFFTIRIFVWAYLPKNDVTDKIMNKYDLFINYIDNEDD